MIRVLYLGQKWAGDRCFRLLAAHSGVEPCGVVTNLTADNWWRTNGVHRDAVELGIPVLSNEDRNDDALKALIEEHGPDAIVSVQHPWILPPDHLAAVNGRAFNLHAARLPDYAGHNAVNHVILQGERTHTVTIHWMTESVDSGDAAFEETIPVLAEDTARSLYERALTACERAFTLLLDALASGVDELPRRPLMGEPRFYPRSSIDSEREIRSLDDPQDVSTRSRALYFPPFEPAFTTVDGQKQYIFPRGFAAYVHEFADMPW